jgi:hypothetical protein
MTKPALFTLNSSQRQIVRRWPRLLAAFLSTEWRSAALGYSCGVLVGSGINFVRVWAQNGTNVLRTANLVKSYEQLLGRDAPNYFFLALPLAIILLVAAAAITRRAINSWVHGLTSGSYLWPFVVALACFWNAGELSMRRAATAFGVSSIALVVGFALRLWAAVGRERTVDRGAIKLFAASAPSYSVRDLDAPIDSWDEDLLNRSAFVEMLALNILVSKPAVIMLRGSFGDGKSSVLRLLRLGIGQGAIVVPFNSWLPNSQQTFVNDLFGDIAAEISRSYLVPGLRKRLRTLASILAGTVPQLKGLSELLPASTQRDEIKDLEIVLARVPRRIVVLLDEIDRMQKDELLALLKVLRGATSLQNVTFVCAFDQTRVEKIAFEQSDRDSHEALEKFFPTIVDLPPPGAEVLKSLFKDRLAAIFEEACRDSPERDSFHKRFDGLWQSALSDICTNIRKVSLLANDARAATELIRGEVDALDVIALLAARRFFPDAYDLIWKNASFFSQSDSWWKSRRFRSDSDLAAQAARIEEDIKLIAQKSQQSPIYPLLSEMFPAPMKALIAHKGQSDSNEDFAEAEKGKRISHPDYFPIYFLYAVPELIFSSLEMGRFTKELTDAHGDDEVRAVFGRTFLGFEPESLRRYDFVNKLVNLLQSLPLDLAKSVAFAVVHSADKFGDEFLVSERRRAVVAILQVAQRLSESVEINGFLATCILQSKTDLFAANLFKVMTSDQAINKVVKNFEHVDRSKLQEAFADRMAARFDGGNVADISQVEVYAMLAWSQLGPGERSKEVAFWTRYIGTSRARLADAFNVLAAKGTFWTKEAPAYIEQVIGRDLLAELDAKLPDDPHLSPQQEEGLDRLRRFLAGELKPGEILGGSPIGTNVIGEAPSQPVEGDGPES